MHHTPGVLIVTGSTEPCLAACRALKEMGFSGRLEMWDTVLPYVRLTVDIGKAAKKTIREGDQLPRLVEYVSFTPRSALDGDLVSEATLVPPSPEKPPLVPTGGLDVQ